jgi:hypothetical protein
MAELVAAAANSTLALANAAATVAAAAVPTPAAAATVFSPAAAAVRDGGLVAGFNGSGFLIFFYVGVMAALERAGVLVQGVTPMGGVSGGAISAAAFHSGMTPEQRLVATTALNARCHPSNGCPGFLGKALREELQRFFPADAYKKAAPPATTIFVSKIKGNATALASARPNTLLLPAVPATISYDSQALFLDGLAASSYVPKWSGASRFMVYRGEAVYDGGPTAGGRSCPERPAGLAKNASYYCVRIECTVGPNAASLNAARNANRTAAAAPSTANGRRLLRAATNIATNSAAAKSPLAEEEAEEFAEDLDMEWAASAAGSSVEGEQEKPDIYIGMPGAPRVELAREQIRAYTLLTMPPQYIKYFYTVGEQAAEAWLKEQSGMAEAVAIARARRAAAGGGGGGGGGAAAAVAAKDKPDIAAPVAAGTKN